MKKLTCMLLALMTLSVGCLANTPATDAAHQEIAAQHQAAVAALQAYCGVIDTSDSEMKKVCDSVAPVALQSEAAVQLALGIIFNILTKRETLRQVSKDFECHNLKPQ